MHGLATEAGNVVSEGWVRRQPLAGAVSNPPMPRAFFRI